MLATFISEDRGGIATWVSLLRVVDPRELTVTGGEDSRLPFREVDPILASRRVATAIDRTDAQLPLPVGSEFSMCRALGIARVTPAPTALTHDVAS